MIERAEWIPSGRRRRHPSDRAAFRWAVSAWPIYASALIVWLGFGHMISDGRADFFAIWFAILAVASLPALWLTIRIWAGDDRDRRAFADLGERDGDFAEVEVRLWRGKSFLGSDQGFLWVEGGGTVFAGERLAFRLPGGTLARRPHDLYVFDGALPDGGRVEVEGVGRSAVQVSPPAEAGPVTWPPLVRDPELRPPSLLWRAPFVAGWGMLGGWATTNAPAWVSISAWTITATSALLSARTWWLDRRVSR